MADDKKIDYIGSRFRLIDPNDFQNQSATGLFGDPNYNISIPQEDLSIFVELRTQTKNRTVLNTKQDKNTIINKTNSDININFIDGTKDKTTGGEDYLTTSYTNISADLKNVDEAFGITSIDIDFNSSYAPMVNINFVDVKGAALFQLGATSKYNVLFRLPYPIFELTIKGYYGKPVKYCLHMLKCNTKFNSSNGNFEIAAQFVGYTYAMLSDILLGYIKAAGLTPAGKDLLKKRGIISIAEYMKKVADINQGVPEEVLTPSDETVSNVSAIKDIKDNLNDMKSLALSFINRINLGGYQVIDVPTTNENGITLKESIAIVIDPVPTEDGFKDTNNDLILQNYNKEISEKIKSYNKKLNGLEELSLSNSENDMKCIVNLTYYDDINNKSEDLKNDIKTSYSIETEIEINNIFNRFKSAMENGKEEKNYVKIYDVTNALLIINSLEKKINIKQEQLTNILGNKLKDYITNQLGFDTSIRNIVNLFTTHIEVFLEQIYDISSQYTDKDRNAELKIFKDPAKSKQIDVYNRDIENDVIYPWPEYHENNVEKYLGSKNGPLKNPLNVPEIKFVEELYEAMVKQRATEDELGKLENKSIQIWLATNPIDSYYFNKEQTNPYKRLGDSATHDDFARLALLRAVAYMGFSNKFLDTKEIINFAQQEVYLIIDAVKDDTNNKIINGLNTNYNSPYKFITITGNTKDSRGQSNRLIIKEGAADIPTTKDTYVYDYIFPLSNSSRAVIPISKDFSDADYNGANEFTHGYTLSNVVVDVDYNNQNKYDKIKYISFIKDYKNSNLTLPITIENQTFEFEALKKEISTYKELEAAGFVSNAGLYGVQEFSKINYNNVKDSPFFTLFYDDGNINIKSASLAGPRKTDKLTNEEIETPFDLKSYINLPSTNKKTFSFVEINEIYESRENSYENILLISEYVNNNNTNVHYPFFNFVINNANLTSIDPTLRINLFGSRLYNAQTLEGKAFLFLHSLPWRGLTSKEPGSTSNLPPFSPLPSGPFTLNSILNVFKNRTGFIQIPEYFPAFLGGVIKRSRTEILKFFNDTECLIPDFTASDIPPKNCYLTDFYQKGSASIAFTNITFGKYVEVEDVLLKLPYQAKQILVQEFENFIKKYDNEIRQNFEILPLGSGVEGDDKSWKDAWDNIQLNVQYYENFSIANINLTDIEANLKLKNEKTFSDTYKVFSFIPNTGFDLEDGYYDKLKYNYYVEYKDGSDPETKLREIVSSYKYMSNESIYIWSQAVEIVDVNYNVKNVDYKTITIPKDSVITYFNEFKSIVANEVSKMQQNKKFLTTDQEEIKLEIYRNLKKIYDKWIAFSDTKEKILFQCCYTGTRESERLTTDKNVQKHRNASQLGLIDSFRFVDSFFRDIGDDFNINPFMVNEMLLDTTNTSFYSFLSRILTDNNFDFIALPSFVDYNDEKEIQNIFKAYPYYEVVNDIARSGPSFVCVYVGQTSTKLDFSDDEESQYPNDGFDLSKNCTDCPEGVKGQSDGDIKDVAAAFVVKYGQQNQNFFKDVTLDQAEFGATAESLEITDAISSLGSDTNKSYYGQNLYDVYSIRSYKVEVEMLGDAMIQPMMYFQLDNIPMFHGAYLITHVKHNIKPNNMLTVFNGTRIKSTQTPILDAASLYGALLSSFSLPEGSGVLTNRVSGSFPPIVATIIGNGGAPSNIIAGNITMKKVPKIDGVYNDKSTAPDNRDSMLTEATNALEAMLNAFVSDAKTNKFPTLNNDGKTYIGITSLFRDEKTQTKTYNDIEVPGGAANPGTSNHQWGIAVDLQFINDKGQYIGNNSANQSIGFDTNQNKSLKWFLDNGYKYGYIIPIGVRNGGANDEFWHFEYHGTSAKCLYPQTNPDVKGYKPKIDGNYESIVINPLTSENKRAVYDSGCDFVTLSYADGTESLSTITKGELAENQLKIKKLLKSNGYTKIGAAGAMGNIQIESGFNPTVKPFFDRTKQYSWGLIQWNGDKYNNYALIGKTVESQMEYLFNEWPKERPVAKKYKELNDSNGFASVYDAGFQFARLVEACNSCGSLDAYNTNKQYEPYRRSLAANDFFKRFNNPNDPLYWEGDGTQTTVAGTESPTVIVIGDSQTPYISKRCAKAKVISTTGGENALWQDGINLAGLKTFVDKYQTNTTIKKIFISIGTNGKFSANDDIPGLVSSLRTKFPNAELFVVQGSWGWGYNIFNTKNEQETTVYNYYQRFETLNVTVLDPPIGETKDPHKDLPIYIQIGKKIDAFSR